MKIKSFSAGTTNGVEGAMEVLDRKVRSELGTEVTFLSVTDTYYGEAQTGNDSPTPRLPRIVRVVVYDDPS